MRRYSEKKSRLTSSAKSRASGGRSWGAIVKILSLALFFTVILAGLIIFLNLDSVFFRGPKTVVQLITDTGLKSANGRVNVLVLGTGGQGHEGPNLSDTMILASIDKKGSDVAIISIPRDLWAPSLSAKINHAYAYGEEKNGQGLELAESTIQELFGVPIHYAVRVDFNGFIKAVDMVQGLDIEIETPFVDSRYPVPTKEEDLCGLTIEKLEIDGVTTEVVKDATGSAIPLSEITDQNNPFICRYETLTFKKGTFHMDGATALKFVRSRHGTNNEGSDFARSARQQKVILAFRQKVISKETLTSPTTIIDLVKTFNESLDIDISSDDIPLFAKLFQKINPANIRRIVLDSGRPESVLDEGNPVEYHGQFALDPKSNNWTDLAEYVQGEIFKLEEK